MLDCLWLNLHSWREVGCFGENPGTNVTMSLVDLTALCSSSSVLGVEGGTVYETCVNVCGCRCWPCSRQALWLNC